MRFLAVASAMLALSASVRRAGAQTVETPIAFDSAQRVTAVTPVLAERLHLAPPVWPVLGEYREARLYRASPDGGFVLVAARAGGAFERFVLQPDQAAVLRAAIDAAVIATGHPGGDLVPDISEPAGNGFARHLTVLSAFAYGPLAASLANDPKAGGALYLLTTGGTFFISYDAAQSGHITRAQSDLASNLGLAMGLGGWGLGFAAAGNSDTGVRGAALGSALVGTIAGASLGRTMTDAEAHGAIVGIETAAAATWALASAAGASDRATAGIVAGSELVGFPLGVAYPRGASYRVTAGDLNAVQTAGLVGALYGAAIGGRSGASSRQLGIALGSSYVAGALVGDLAIARPLDLSTSEANIGTVGALAGSLIGLAAPVLAESDDNGFVFGAAAVGATLGFSAALAIANPSRERSSQLRRAANQGRESRVRVTVATPAILGMLQHRPGVYPLVRLSF